MILIILLILTLGYLGIVQYKLENETVINSSQIR